MRVRRGPVAKIAETGLSQTTTPGGSVELLVGGWIEAEDRRALQALRIEVEVSSPGGEPVWEGGCGVKAGTGGSFSVSASLENPERWWLNGLGDPATHTVAVRLLSGGGDLLDETTQSVGFRELKIVGRPDGSFALSCNGIEVFARGAVYSPGADPDFETTIVSARDAHFNAIRLKAGEALPPDALFRACDAAGIAVLGVALADAADAGDATGDSAGAARLSHPCVPDNPLDEPEDDGSFETMRSVPSWAAPETIENELPGALAAINGTAMNERTELRGGVSALAAALLASWPMPKSPAGWVYLSQIAQAHEARRRIAAARIAFAGGGSRECGGEAPRTTGFFASALRSGIAGADGSSIDAAGVWKALHYEFARSFAPEALFCVCDDFGRLPRAFRVVDANAAPEATLFCWRLATLDGTTLAASTHALAGARAPVEPLPLPGMEPFFAVNRREDMVLWLCLKDARGCVVARDKALFAPPRCLALQDPGISLDVSQIADESGEQVFRVGVSASAPAFGVSILLPGIPALVEDSFFDIEPDETVEVHVATLRNVGETEFRAALRAMSLFDL